jgi:ketosteroid isomerase-like protein
MNGSMVLNQFFTQFQAAFERGDANLHAKVEEKANVALVQRFFQAMESRDEERIADCMADDIHFEVVGTRGNPFVGQQVGKHRVLVRIASNFTRFADMVPNIETVVAQGDTVVAIGHVTGRYVETNTRYEAYWIMHFTCNLDKIAKWRDYVSFIKSW